MNSVPESAMRQTQFPVQLVVGENRPKAAITRSGWRDAIRPERPLQCARNCR